MSLSFKTSRPAFALWWGMCWRSMLWMLAFVIPLMALSFVLYFIIAFLMILGGFEKSTAVSIIRILSFTLNNIAAPIGMMGFIFWRLFRKAKFGRYNISGTYNGLPVTTLMSSLKFGIFIYLEMLKYIWPLFFAGIGYGIGIATGIIASVDPFLILLCLIVMVYTHILVLTDLIRRRSFNRCTLLVEKAAA